MYIKHAPHESSPKFFLPTELSFGALHSSILLGESAPLFQVEPASASKPRKLSIFYPKDFLKGDSDLA